MLVPDVPVHQSVPQPIDRRQSTQHQKIAAKLARVTSNQARLSQQNAPVGSNLILRSIAPPTVISSSLISSISSGGHHSESKQEQANTRKTELLNSTSQHQSASQQAALFQKIFGSKGRAAQTNVMTPWWINGQLQGNILVSIKQGEPSAIRFTAQDFLQAGNQFIQTAIHAKLSQAVDRDGFIASDALRKIGLEVVFDNQRLELRIQVPPALRKTQKSSLQRQKSQTFDKTIQPSHVSGYLNLRGSQTIDWLGSANHPSGRQPLQFALDGMVNWGGWVLESDAQFSEGRRWQRGNIRLLHDDTQKALRYAIGDISTPTTGYQTSKNLLGIAVARNYSLQPDRVTRPINQFQFFLERRSQVEVFSNGRSLQTLSLEAGPQDLRDLPVGAGVNDVQLIITDDLGQVKRLDFATTTASSLLAPGLQQFAYSLGVPERQDNGQFSYDWDQPTLNLAYRWGANQRFTTGTYLQANFQSQLLGWEGYLATPIGMWNWDIAGSHDRQYGTGLAARLRYDFIKLGKNNPTQRTFGFTAEYRGANFISPLTNLSNLSPQTDTWLDLNAYYRQKLFGTVNANFSGRYQFNRQQNHAYQIALGLSHTLSRQLSVTANLSHKQSQNGDRDQRISINVNWRRLLGAQSFQTNSSFQSDASTSHRLSWNYNSPNPIHGLKSNLGFNVTDQGVDLSSRLSFPSYRFNLDLTHNGSLLGDSTTSKQQITQFNFGTAIAFSDGHWALSRPINGSFAMVVPHQNLKQHMIGLNADGKGGYAAIAKGKTAVVPGLSPYQPATLRLHAPDLPIGMDIGASTIEFLPGYKTGTLIRAGNDANVFLRGVLQDNQGQAIRYATGTIVSQSDPQWKPITLFTNKAGRFALLGFKPGEYEIQLSHPGKYQLKFVIPKNASGIYSLGPMQIKTLRQELSKAES